MGVLHPIRRIDALNRGNRACARQIESTIWSAHRRSGTLARMTKSDPMLAQIAAQFTQFDVAKSRGGYTILDRRTSSPIARLRPIPEPIDSSSSIGRASKGAGRHSGTSAA